VAAAATAGRQGSEGSALHGPVRSPLRVDDVIGRTFGAKKHSQAARGRLRILRRLAWRFGGLACRAPGQRGRAVLKAVAAAGSAWRWPTDSEPDRRGRPGWVN